VGWGRSKRGVLLAVRSIANDCGHYRLGRAADSDRCKPARDPARVYGSADMASTRSQQDWPNRAGSRGSVSRFGDSAEMSASAPGLFGSYLKKSACSSMWGRFKFDDVVVNATTYRVQT
jgi:hypothetical protein